MAKTDTKDDVDVEALKERIVELRDGGSKWEEISTEVGIAANRAMFLYMQAGVKPKDRIKGKDDDELGDAIANARDVDKLSWGQIMARSGLGEARCRSLYEKATGKSTKGNRIGKGGRYPAGVTPPERATPKAKAKAEPKAPAAKKTAAKKAPASKFVGKSYEELAEALTGKAVTYKSGGKQAKLRVADVADLVGEGADAEVTVETTEGESVTIAVKSIVRAAAR
jgi:hypothetical protein